MGVVLVILLMAGLAPLVPSATADTVIGAEEVGLIEAGDFSEPESWQISSTAGFSSNPAEHSEGMVADGTKGAKAAMSRMTRTTPIRPLIARQRERAGLQSVGLRFT